MSKKETRYKVTRLCDIPQDQLRDPSDCHRIPFLDNYIGRRATIVTTKGTVKGYLQYTPGWYYCQAPFYLVDDKWTYSHKRFCFKKGQFKSIKPEPKEGSLGI